MIPNSSTESGSVWKLYHLGGYLSALDNCGWTISSLGPSIFQQLTREGTQEPGGLPADFQGRWSGAWEGLHAVFEYPFVQGSLTLNSKLKICNHMTY